MENSTFIFVLALISVFAQAYSLQCYVCENCGTVTEEQLKTCAAIEPPANSTGTPAPPTGGTGTAAPPTGGTGTAAPPTSGTGTAAPPTSGTGTGTAAPPAGGTGTAAPPTGGTGTAAPSIDGPESESDTQEQPSALRVKRYALESFFAKLDFRAEESYSCYKVVRKVNGTDQTFRGCGLNLNTNQTLCQEINTQINTTACLSCTTDRCNGATLIQFSLIPLLILFFVVGVNK